MSSHKSKKKIVSYLLIIVYLTLTTGCRTMMRPVTDSSGQPITEVENWMRAVDPNRPDNLDEKEEYIYAVCKEAGRTYILPEKTNPHSLFNGGGKSENPVNHPSRKENIKFPKQMEVNNQPPPIPKEEPVKPKRGWIITAVITIISAIAIGVQDVPKFAVTVVQACKGGC